jgi:hypothetical protein
VRTADSLATFICHLARNSGSLNLPETYRPVQTCTRNAFNCKSRTYSKPKFPLLARTSVYRVFNILHLYFLYTLQFCLFYKTELTASFLRLVRATYSAHLKFPDLDFVIHYGGTRGSVVVISARLRTWHSGVLILVEQKVFLFNKKFRRARGGGAHRIGGFSCGVNRSAGELSHSPLSGAYCKKGFVHVSSLLACRAWKGKAFFVTWETTSVVATVACTKQYLRNSKYKHRRCFVKNETLLFT